MPLSLILKFGGPVILILGLWWWHSSAVAAVQEKLDVEVIAHAQTTERYDTLQVDMLEANAARTAAVIKAVANSQRQFDRILRSERLLREEAEQLRANALADKRAAQARIAELLNDEENFEWAATYVPIDWVNWMYSDAVESTGLPSP